MKSGFRSLTLIEDILIILAVFALWPTILGWQGTIIRIIQYLALGVLVVIFIRRIGKIRNF